MRHLRDRLFLLFPGLLCLVFHAAWSQEDPGVGESDDLLTLVEDYTDRWMETQRLITDAKSGWLEEREILQHNVELLEREQKSLNEKLEGHRLAASLYDRTRRIVSETLEEQRDGTMQIAAMQDELEERVERLVPQLPDQLRESLEPHLQRMATGRASEEVGIANRVQNLIAMLAVIDQFSNNLTLTHMVRSSEDDGEYDVRILYWGLAFAYAVDTQGKRAWLLRPTEEGWGWLEQHDRAAKIEAIIDIYEKRRKPVLVTLPAYLD